MQRRFSYRPAFAMLLDARNGSTEFFFFKLHVEQHEKFNEGKI